MKESVASLLNFFKNDFFPNLPYYLLQIFLIVVMLLIFAGINIGVRMITDPICTKVLRMKEHKRGPGMVGLVITLLICAFLLAWTYSAVPQLRPTVIGWTGEKIQNLFTKVDKLPDLEGVPTDRPVPVPPESDNQPVKQPPPVPEPGEQPPRGEHGPP